MLRRLLQLSWSIKDAYPMMFSAYAVAAALPAASSLVTRVR